MSLSKVAMLAPVSKMLFKTALTDFSKDRKLVAFVLVSLFGTLRLTASVAMELRSKLRKRTGTSNEVPVGKKEGKKHAAPAVDGVFLRRLLHILSIAIPGKTHRHLSRTFFTVCLGLAPVSPQVSGRVKCFC